MIPFLKKNKDGKKPPKSTVPRTAQESIPFQRMFEDGTPMRSCWLPARKILNPVIEKNSVRELRPVTTMQLSSDTASLKRYPCPQNDRSV